MRNRLTLYLLTNWTDSASADQLGICFLRLGSLAGLSVRTLPETGRKVQHISVRYHSFFLIHFSGQLDLIGFEIALARGD
jgi:hypothetical protein